MKSIGEALRDMMPAFAPVGRERVSLTAALGRFLATEVLARSDLPPFDNSAMDGYAVRSTQLRDATAAHPVELPVVGESRAGGGIPPPLPVGAVTRVFTGAAVPEDADAVVAQEDTTREGDLVRIGVAPQPGSHIRRRGEDLGAGSTALGAGARLQAGEIGLLASQGHAHVTVYRRPTVSILSTGDELRDVSDPKEPGTLVNSNAYALAGQVLDAGGVPRILPLAPDDLASLVASLHDALGADVVISSGGVSVGDYDFLHRAFVEVGVEASFWKVAVKPGKPLTFGKAGRVPVVGLPGNPVSAMVTFAVFVRPGIRRMLGDPCPYPGTVTVRLAASHRRQPGRVELARARIERRGGHLIAHLMARQGSGALPSMVGVDALVILPGEARTLEQGQELTALPFGAPSGSDQPAFR